MQDLLKFIQIIIILISALYDVKAKKVCYEMSDDSGDGDEMIAVGDMILTPEQCAGLFGNDSRTRRHGLVNAFRHWPDGIVPVVIERGFSASYRKTIKAAMRYIMRHSCVFFDWTNTPEKDYVLIKPGNRCASQVGCVKCGAQELVLHTDCHKGNIVHELLHALGLLHMHTAVDRDDYIIIAWENIRDDAKFNFKKYTNQVSMFDTPYDYASIMHYGEMSFSRDKLHATIIPMRRRQQRRYEKLGQRERMSDGDIIRLNRMYNCRGYDLTHFYDDNVDNDEDDDDGAAEEATEEDGFSLVPFATS